MSFRRISPFGVLAIFLAACSSSSNGAPTSNEGGSPGSSSSGGSGGDSGSGDSGSGDSGAIGASGLPAPPTTGVAQPAGAVGGLKVLNWAGFTAAVTFSFDDANQSQITNYPDLKALGVPFTFYLWGARIAMNNNLSTWTQILQDGHEFANHTQTHQTVASFATTAAAAMDVDQGQQTIQTDFPSATVQTFAAPMGDTGYSPIAQTRYLLNRGANGQVGQACQISAGDETIHSPFNACGNVTTATPTTAAMLDSDIDATRSGGTWYVLVVHGFTGDTAAYNPLALSDFEGGVNHAKMLGDVWIDTMTNVGAYWRGQNAFNKATMTGAAGSAQTWTWSLPANFPPGRFLRVTVTGGTPSQGGTKLPWNTHGYYEVALDVGSLTLSP